MHQESTRRAGPALLAAMLGAVGIGQLLLFGLSATSDRVITDLGIDEAQFGLLATVCFGCAAIGNATLGRLADRHSDLALMTVVFLLAAGGMVLAGVPAGYALLLIAAGLAGFAQSFPNGVTNRILLERVPERQRIGWVGIKQSGVQVAQLVASLSFPLVALVVGWRGAALLATLIPVALLILTWHTLRTVPRLSEDTAPDDAGLSTGDEAGPATSDDDAESAHPTTSAPARPRFPGAVWALAAFGLLNGIGAQATNVYLPLFAVRELDFSLVLGGATAAVAGVVGVAARVGWARVMARGASAPALLLTLALTALAGAGAFLGSWAGGWSALLWVAVALHGASALGVTVVLMSALMRTIPSSSMASASGAVSAGMFAGFTLGPLGMGGLVSSPGGFPLGWAAVGGVYLACVVLAVVLVVRARRA